MHNVSKRIPKSVATVAVAVAVAATGAIAAGAAEGDAQISVGPQVTLKAGQTAPFDAGGVRAVRRDKPIPSGYVLVGRKVTIDRGTSGSVGAAFKLSCPSGKTARTLGGTGQTPSRRPRRGLVAPARPTVDGHELRRLPLTRVAGIRTSDVATPYSLV